MGATRYASVLGLGFGDCGKGLFIDALTRRWQAHTVVRFNGGAQAGHNVVERVVDGGVDGATRHHTFSQFGAGTFVSGVHTVLVDPVIVHPTALLVEAQALSRIGVHDALARLAIDAQCRVTTPFHQAAGRLRERLRGSAAHGTCGVGVGETMRHALAQHAQVLRYGELAPVNAVHTLRLVEKLQFIRKTLANELLAALAQNTELAAFCLADADVKALQDESVAARWLASAQALARQCPPQSTDAISYVMSAPGCVLFEGAQGVLLDEYRGFHPHTTWSTISTQAVDIAAQRFGVTAPVEHYGALRSYLTRHGAGPFPTHDTALDVLPEPHNNATGWQGSFRRGHPDAILLRYALDVVGPLAGLLVSHMDIFERGSQRGLALKWCESYGATPSEVAISRLAPSLGGDLAYQGRLTQLLLSAQPNYADELVSSPAALLARIASVTALPVKFCAYGPQHTAVHAM